MKKFPPFSAISLGALANEAQTKYYSHYGRHLGWQDIACHKLDAKPVYETPHLDRLTRIGRRFTRLLTCSNMHHLVSFLRGQYPIKLELITFMEAVSRAWRKAYYHLTNMV